ncbi:MAG: Crp/Fnr family transcriptional regulator [Chitinophagales bacterium]
MHAIENKLSSILETRLVDEILKAGKVVQYKEGDIIIDYDKSIKSMPIILTGTVRVMKRDETGREILLYYLSSNDSCAMAYTCCMEARKSEIKAIAEDNVEIIAVPHSKLDEWLVKYPSWKSYIFNSFTQRFNELLKSLESVAFQKLDERLVNYLKNKTKVSGKKVVSLSHQQIADELGTSRVVVSRLLKQLENDKKVILYRNELKVLNTL